MRPLDRLPSIKLKLGVVIVAAVLFTVVAVSAGQRAGLSVVASGLVAVIAALLLVQFLAHGMTSPLREMVAAARAMAAGDYGARVTATSRDEVGELARAFNSMAAELAATDRVRRDLVANVSHELRTPISALRAVLENLIDGVEPVGRTTLETTLGQVERLGALVEQLLDLSALESGVVPIRRRPIDVGALLNQVAAEWEAPARECGVALAVSVAPGTALVGDEERLHQVVTNLVANAVRHAPRGGRVELRAAGAGRGARLEVVDDGPGVSPAEAGRIFERFYRSDRARGARDGGAGLGLAIVRWIVELHGGSVRAERAEPRGCRMVVELPG
jgi:signal transduction histidine kinase